MIAGAVDIGGTKMQAELFGPEMESLARRRCPTPQDYDAFLGALLDQIGWLRAQAGQPDLPVGLAIAGLQDPKTGLAVASNLPVSGRDLLGDLARALGHWPRALGDCDAFALSEAVDGAGAGHGVVLGLIIGTGMAAGLCMGGALAPRATQQAVEIGHVGMPARALKGLDLPDVECGCGLTGCIEKYVAGPGIETLSRARIGRALNGEALAEGIAAGEADCLRLYDDWAGLVAEALSILHMMHDPDVIVLGGGLSHLPGVIPKLTEAFAGRGLPGNTHRPLLALAQNGAGGGTRGAALLLRQEGGGWQPRAGQC